MFLCLNVSFLVNHSLTWICFVLFLAQGVWLVYSFLYVLASDYPDTAWNNKVLLYTPNTVEAFDVSFSPQLVHFGDALSVLVTPCSSGATTHLKGSLVQHWVLCIFYSPHWSVCYSHTYSNGYSIPPLTAGIQNILARDVALDISVVWASAEIKLFLSLTLGHLLLCAPALVYLADGKLAFQAGNCGWTHAGWLAAP